MQLQKNACCKIYHRWLSFKKAGEGAKKKSVHKPLFHSNINFIYISTFRIDNVKMQNKIKKKGQKKKNMILDGSWMKN